MAALDPRIETIRAAYNLDRNDFWELPQKKGTWLAKHSALETVAVHAKIDWMPPQIVEAKSGDGIAAMIVTGRMPDGREEWATGEASPKNNKNAYPWAMAEKRGKDRVILKLVGLHGLVYSEEEGDFELPKAKARDVYSGLQADIDGCDTLDMLAKLWADPETQSRVKSLPEDWRDEIVKRKDDRKAAIEQGRVLLAG